MMTPVSPRPAPSPPSWYAASEPPLPLNPPLRGAGVADVCVLGAGYTGLSAALALAEAGFRVTVLEAQRIGWGASGRNGGQAIVGYGCEQDTLERLLGADEARVLFDFSRQGMARLRERIARHHIACDWRDGHASVPIRARQERDLRAGVIEMAQRYDYPLQWWDKAQLQQQLASDRYRGAMYDPASGHLHPLAYAHGLARAALAAGVTIHEYSPVQRLQRGKQPELHTAEGHVRADFVVLAGNAWLAGIAPELESRMMPVGTYIGATPPLGEGRARALIRNDMAVADVNWALDYFRLSRDHRLLFGGRASYSALPPPGLRGVMSRPPPRWPMPRCWPTSRPRAWCWSTVVSMPPPRTCPVWAMVSPCSRCRPCWPTARMPPASWPVAMTSRKRCLPASTRPWQTKAWWSRSMTASRSPHRCTWSSWPRARTPSWPGTIAT